MLKSLLTGADVPPEDYCFGTAIAVETPSAEHAWVERCLFVASCIRAKDAMR